MAEANNQETVKETQNPDLDKSPLASALFRHLEKYYSYPTLCQENQEEQHADR